MKYNTIFVLTLLFLALFIFSCEKEIPKGCCYYSIFGQVGGFNYSWGCVDNSIESSCEDAGAADTTVVNYFLEDVECSNVQYCTESACEAIGCEWYESDFGNELCRCN